MFGFINLYPSIKQICYITTILSLQILRAKDPTRHEVSLQHRPESGVTHAGTSASARRTGVDRCPSAAFDAEMG